MVRFSEMSVQNVITILELSMGLEKIKNTCGVYIWEVKDWCFVDI